MNKILMLLAFIPSIAHAGQVTITVDDKWKTYMENTQVLLDRCIGSSQMRGDMAPCRDIYAFLSTLGSLQLVPVPTPTPPQNNAPPATPAPSASPSKPE
jgi:hypothetical protein